MRKMYLQSVMWKEGGYYVSQCFNVDISSFGKTKRWILGNFSKASELYLEDNKTPKITLGIIDKLT